MTEHARKMVRAAVRKIEQNSSVIRQKISGNVKPDLAILSSAAKYREALERLARE